VSVADRDEPAASCSEWHADGTAGENDCASGLAAMGRQLGRWARPDQGDTSLVGKGHRAAAAWMTGLDPFGRADSLAGRTVWGAAAVMLGG
jgi:hypothetical protein